MYDTGAVILQQVCIPLKHMDRGYKLMSIVNALNKTYIVKVLGKYCPISNPSFESEAKQSNASSCSWLQLLLQRELSLNI